MKQGHWSCASRSQVAGEICLSNRQKDCCEFSLFKCILLLTNIVKRYGQNRDSIFLCVETIGIRDIKSSLGGIVRMQFFIHVTTTGLQSTIGFKRRRIRDGDRGESKRERLFLFKALVIDCEILNVCEEVNECNY